MADHDAKKYDEEQKKKQEREEKKEKKQERRIDLNEERLIRILSTDIPGSKKLYAGLTRIKGVSWSFANAICGILKINKNKLVSELTKEEIERIGEFIKNPKVPEFLLNRRKDRDTGISSHISGADLDLQKEFDIKRLKKIRSYRGWRHAFGQPTRGQRTKSHFRKAGKKKAVGVQTNKPKPAAK